MPQNYLPYLKDINTGGPTHSYDVLSYTMNLNLFSCYSSPFSRYFKSKIVIHIKVDTALNSVKLDADTASLTIDSVRLAGVSFTHVNNILTVNLNRTYNAGEEFSIRVCYHHNDVVDGAFYVQNDGHVFTDCEPEGARHWFPCWDKPSAIYVVDFGLI